jgi:trehalose-phosphatase
MAPSRPIREVPHYGVGLDWIRAELTAGPASLFLDFDGTLAPIVERPDDAAASDAMLDAVGALTLVAPVAIISGRDTDDLARRLKTVGLTLAGSHGFDLLHPDGRRERFGGDDLMGVLDAAQAALVEGTRNDPGVQVERKEFAIAVHTRRAADDHARIAAQVLAHRVADTHPELRSVEGKQIIELRPVIDWHKGRVVRHLLDAFAEPHVPIVIGDDTTDEDAFEVVNAGRGVSVVVRGEDDWRPTVADWSADDPEDVRRLLQQLGGLLGV